MMRGFPHSKLGSLIFLLYMNTLLDLRKNIFDVGVLWYHTPPGGHSTGSDALVAECKLQLRRTV